VRRVTRRIRRAVLPPDTFSRHLIASQLLGRPATVLDVGGVHDLLALFLPETSVTTVNVERPADVLYEGDRLPFGDASFDAVTSLDVLEHVEARNRQAHLLELARVASRRVVLSCPLGTPEHNRAELDLARWYRATTGVRHRFLEEHLMHGLPTEPDIRETADRAGLDAHVLFHGDFRSANRTFALSTRVRRERRPDLLARYVRARFLDRRVGQVTTSPMPWTNRLFLAARVAD
jgi:hypothetical protein